MRTACPCACDGDLDLRFQDVPTGHTDELMGMELMTVLNFPQLPLPPCTLTERAWCLLPRCRGVFVRARACGSVHGKGERVSQCMRWAKACFLAKPFSAHELV